MSQRFFLERITELFSCTAQGPTVIYIFLNVEDVYYFMVMICLAYWEGNIPAWIVSFHHQRIILLCTLFLFSALDRFPVCHISSTIIESCPHSSQHKTWSDQILFCIWSALVIAVRQSYALSRFITTLMMFFIYWPEKRQFNWLKIFPYNGDSRRSMNDYWHTQNNLSCCFKILMRKPLSLLILVVVSWCNWIWKALLRFLSSDSNLLFLE